MLFHGTQLSGLRDDHGTQGPRGKEKRQLHQQHKMLVVSLFIACRRAKSHHAKTRGAARTDSPQQLRGPGRWTWSVLCFWLSHTPGSDHTFLSCKRANHPSWPMKQLLNLCAPPSFPPTGLPAVNGAPKSIYCAVWSSLKHCGFEHINPPLPTVRRKGTGKWMPATLSTLPAHSLPSQTSPMCFKRAKLPKCPNSL